MSVWESVGTIPHYQLHWLFTERRARAGQETIISQLSNNVLLHAALVEGFLHETTQRFPQCTHSAHLVVLTCVISVTKVKTIGSHSCQSMFLTSGQNQLCKSLACISGEPVWHYTSSVPPSWFFPQYTYFCVFPVCVYITVYLIVHSVTAPGQTKPFHSVFTPKLEATEAVSLRTSLSDYRWYLQCNPILATVGSGFMYWLTCVTRESERNLPRFLFTTLRWEWEKRLSHACTVGINRTSPYLM